MKKISIIGIPYDDKSSFLRGPAEAPPLIREWLMSGVTNLYAENGIDTGDEAIIDFGDFTIKSYFDIEALADRQLSEGNMLMSWGGDHSVTYPILKAYKKYHSEFEVLVIDAHADLYDIFDGDKYSHACPFARVMEKKLCSRLIQIGIRTINPHQREQAEPFGVEMIEMKNFDINELPEMNKPIYISIDMDGLDPAFAPGVSHQEAGGLSSRDLIRIIQGINGPIIGADIVEYNPKKDINWITCALAGKLTKELLAKMLE